MNDPQTDHVARQLNLSDYLRILKRRKWVVVAATVLVTAATIVVSVRQHNVYSASAQVLIDRQDLTAAVTGAPQDPTLTEDPARFTATQASLARGTAVVKLAIANSALKDRTAAKLLLESSVTPNPSADLLNFTVHDSDPIKAAELVNAYAAAYVSYKLDIDTTSLKKARNQLIAQIATLRGRGAENTAQYRNLVTNEQQLHTMELLQSPDTVLTHPTTGTKIAPTPKRDGLLGLGFGLLIGVAFVFVLEALDKRIRSEEEIERELEFPLLARLPEPPRRLRERFGLSMLEHPRSVHADAAMRLATSIVFANPDHPARVLLFTSSVQREGKSTTIGNLAVALARSGHSVALVDLDLRQPTLASLFGIHQLTGLTDVAIRQATLDDALVPIRLTAVKSRSQAGYGHTPTGGSLDVLPTGPLPASPGEFVASEALANRVLAPLRERFDYVLIDSPPMCVVGDAATLSARVDALVVVARVGLIDRTSLRDLKRQLSASPAPTLGFVMSGVAVSAAYGYGGYYDEKSGKPVDSDANGSNGAGEALARGRDRAQT